MADLPAIYRQGHTNSGVFYYDPNCRIRFCSFDPEAEEGYQPVGLDKLKNLCSSSEGLILCYNPEGDNNPIYRVVNPFVEAGAVRDIPNPEKEHCAGTARVIAVNRYPIPGDRSLIFRIMCVRPVPSDSAGYTYVLDVYNSRVNRWSHGSNWVDALAKVRPETGVAYRNSSFWLTQNSHDVVYLNVSKIKVGVLKLIDEDLFRARVQGCTFQLGVFGSESGSESPSSLILSALTDAGIVTVYRWEDATSDSGTGLWKEMFGPTLLAPGATLFRSMSRIFQLLHGRAAGLSFLAAPWPLLNPLPRRMFFPLVGERMAGERLLSHALPVLESDLLPWENFPIINDETKRQRLSNVILKEHGNPLEEAGHKRSRLQ